MSRKYFVNQLIDNNQIILENQEFNHLIKVMRKQVGDEITFTDGKGNNFDTILKEIKHEKAIFEVVNIYQEKDIDFEILVCVGLMKGDKNEFVIQKCAELGVSKLAFFESEYCIAKSKDNKIERYNKISLEASKQCGRSINMEVLPTIKFKELKELLKSYDKVICAYEKGGERLNNFSLEKSQKIALIIGSEGGFSENEILFLKQNNTEIATLGKRILRAETAVITLTSIVMSLKGEI